MSNNLSNSNTIMAGIKEVGHKVFGGYAELLRIPHTARYSIGSVIACMPFPMVGMTITISVQHYYGNYSLAGMLTAIQAIALAVATPLLGKLTDKFGQRQVSIPTILVWIVAAVALTTSITNRAPEWVLYCLTPFLAAIPPWGAMSRARWTKILKGDQERTNRALSLCGVLDECMWVIGNPLASTLAVISGLLAFACFSISSLMGALVYGAKNWSIALWKRFYFCLAVVNIGISTFLFAKHLWVIMIIYLIIGVCQAPTWINGNQLMLHLVPPSRLTEGMAWMGAMNSIGSSAGSAIAGQFIDRMGSHGGFMVVTTLALVSLVIALIGFKQIKGSTEQPTLTEVSV